MSVSLYCAKLFCCIGYSDGDQKNRKDSSSSNDNLKSLPQKPQQQQITKQKNAAAHLEEQLPHCTTAPPPAPQSPMHASERTSIGVSSCSDSSHDDTEGENLPTLSSSSSLPSPPKRSVNSSTLKSSQFSDIMVDLDEYLADKRRSDTNLFPLCMVEQPLAHPVVTPPPMDSANDDSIKDKSSSSSSSLSSSFETSSDHSTTGANTNTTTTMESELTITKARKTVRFEHVTTPT